ncbi:hypothetical protein ABZ540_21590 [Nocardia xishanensis]|uniref:hypothetical protein n=1 Tax=Nocardia xishanensis TaxID=238964 RepID=UPI0033E21264
MSDSDVKQWQKFADQARASELYLDSEPTAQQCLAACDQLLQEYSELLVFSRNAQKVAGFGDFNIADELRQLFMQQATGDTNSIDAVILETINVVKDMREVMLISLNRITGQDAEQGAQISSVADDLGASE